MATRRETKHLIEDLESGLFRGAPLHRSEYTPWREKPDHTIRATAHLLNCSDSQVYSLIGYGRLKAVRRNGRTLVTTDSIVTTLDEETEEWVPNIAKGAAARRQKAKAQDR